MQPTKIPALLALVLTISGSLMVINRSDSNQEAANLLAAFDQNELPSVKLAANYKPCGNTIKCPPPPKNQTEQNPDSEDKENDTASGTPRNQSQNNTSEEPNSTQSGNQRPTPAPVVAQGQSNSYIATPSVIKKLEASYKPKTAPIIDLSAKESIEDFLTKKLKEKGTAVSINTVDGKEIKIKNDTKIVFVDTLEESKKLRANNTEKALIIDPSTDSDGDRLADIAEILFFNTDPFNKDSDEDKIWDGHEVDYGTSLNSDSRPNLEVPEITNLHGLKTDQTPIIKGVGLPGKEVTIKAFHLESETNTTICKKVEVDKIAKFACQPEKGLLKTGINYLYSDHLFVNSNPDNRKFVRIDVTQSDSVLKDKAEKVQITEVEKQSTKNILKSKETIVKFIGESLFNKFVQTYFSIISNSEESKKQIISGESNPGELILVTWQSYSLNSVLIADASAGAFESLVPKALNKGEHQALVYSYNTNEKFIQFLKKIIFNKV